MKTDWESPSQDIRIEILPLIDVIFCILTFFILASVVLTRQSGINVDLPSASSGTTQMREMRIVSLDQRGQLFWEQQPIDQFQLIEELQNYKATNPIGLVVLYASQDASYRSVVDVLDLLREEWGDQVALATQPEQERDAGLSEFDSGFPDDLEQFQNDFDVPALDGDSLNQQRNELDNLLNNSGEVAPGQKPLNDSDGNDFPPSGEDSEGQTVPPSGQ
ncbi:MAG: biopolymer transporter ExbD [Elainellaceae cyanobacterium]